MQLLTFTNLYPSSDQPRHGIFVEERLLQLVGTGQVNADVVALRPRNLFSKGLSSGNDVETRRHGIPVRYLNVPTLPLITNWIDPILWARASTDTIANIVRDRRHETILDAHFLYPDGVAAVLLGRKLGMPVVMTARGSDVNVKCENAVMRRWIGWAADRCAAIVTVSEALAIKLKAMHIASGKVHVLPNGVDLQRFRPTPDRSLRSDGPSSDLVLLSVGHLLEAKGHHIAIEALQEIPGATLLIVGEGPEEDALRKLATRLGLATRVRFLGYVPHDKMAAVYSSADFTILASAHEGMPNVMLESLACGTRVIATAVGGVGEVITDETAGSTMQSRSATAVVNCVRSLTRSSHDRSDTRRFSQRLGWQDTIHRQLALYRDVLDRDSHPATGETNP